MTKYIVYVLIAACSLSMVACKSREPQPERSKLTVGEVKRQITKGMTTQAEVVSLFGSPNLVSKNRDEKEVWASNKMSFESSKGSSGVSLILIGGSKATASTTSKSMDLIITFDKNDIVEDYKVIYASY